MFCSLEEAIGAFRQGEFLVLVDDQDRENEGDLIVAAEFITAEKVNFMVRRAYGMFLLAAAPELFERLDIPLSPKRHSDAMTPRFGLSFDARNGVGTGIAATDRAATILLAIDPDSGPDDIVIPGHVLPLMAHPGGIGARRGHTEGSVELARLAGLYPAAVMSEVMTPSGAMAKGEELEAFARRIGCKVIDVAQIAAAALQES